MAIDHPLPTVVDLFDAWATKTPDAIAVECKGRTLTYAHVRNASLHVSKALLSAGAGPGDKIPLLSQLSLELLPCVLGILRVGACYAPMDLAAWSAARIESTLDEISPEVVLATGQPETGLAPTVVLFQACWLDLPFDGSDITLGQLDVIRQSRARDALVYITFTSGTTGKPKGVMIYHHALYQFATLTHDNAFDVQPAERVLLAFSISFDALAAIVFSTITRGGAVVMASWSTFPDVARTCDSLILTPSMLATLDPNGGYDRVYRITLGAEAPNFDNARQWVTPKRKVVYSYGPTEVTIIINWGRVEGDTQPNLGAPNQGVEVFLVDEDMHERDVGEVLVCGSCLAAGYLNNPELTAKKFIQWNGRRAYRTGDLARRVEGVGLVWTGRADRVVKNRGVLVNLDTEVEAAMLRFGDVQAASASLWRGKLMGFVEPATVDLGELRTFMKEHFDKYIVPDEILAYNRFPLTPNGKVDRAALNAQLEVRMAKEDAELDSMACITPYDALRWAFAKCLQIPIKDIDRTSSFSRLGGNSLAAIWMARLVKQQGYTIGTLRILAGDTIERLEESLVKVDEQNRGPATNGHAIADSEATPPIDLHRAMLTQSQGDPSLNCLILRGKFVGARNSETLPMPTPSELQAAWTATLAAHSIYRARFDTQNWTMHDLGRVNFDWQEVSVEREKFDSHLLSVQEAVWIRHRSLTKHQSMDVPYCDMTCVYAPDRKAIGFVWRLHHSLIDPMALTILMRDLDQALTGKNVAPGPDIRDYSRFMQKWKAEKLDTATDFWKRMMKPLGPEALWNMHPPKIPFEGIDIWTILPFETKESVASIEAAAHVHDISTATIIMAAWALVLTEYTRGTFAPFSISRGGRMVPWPEAPSLVAAMNCRVPFATPVPTEATVHDWLAQLHQTLFEVAELENLCQSLDPEISPKQYFQTAVQAFLHMPRSPPSWEMGDKLTSQPKPLGIVWKLETAEDGRSVKVSMEVNQALVDVAWAREVGEVAVQKLEALVHARRSTKLRELGCAA